MTLLKRLVVIAVLAGALFITLPVSSASADICNEGEIWCMPDAQVQIDDTSDPCSNMAIQTLINMSAVTTCTTASDANDTEWWKPPNGSNGIPVIGDIFARLTQMMQTDAMGMLDFVLVHELSGDATDLAPILSCDNAQGVQKDRCTGKGEWFLGQFGLMREVAIYVMIPLYFIMVIQSIAKGSLYNLLRHSLIMLPLAVIGTAVVIVFMQMFLNITDDLCNYIINRATMGLEVDSCKGPDGQTITSTTCGLRNSLAERSIGSSGSIVAFIWFFILIAACIAIYLEMLGRQMGVYFMTLMMPLVMAGMVWSRSIGVAKKLFQYELALIISKVFIVAAISLGMGAFAQSGSASCNQATEQATAQCGNDNANPGAAQGEAVSGDNGFQALAAGSLIILLAAFAGAKIVTLSPAAMAGQQPVWNKGAIASRGQVIAAMQQRTVQLLDYINRNRKPRNNFNSNGVGDGRFQRSDGGNDPLGMDGGDRPDDSSLSGGAAIPPPPPSGARPEGAGGSHHNIPPPPPSSGNDPYRSAHEYSEEMRRRNNPTFTDPLSGDVLKPVRPMTGPEGELISSRRNSTGGTDNHYSITPERGGELFMAGMAQEHHRLGGESGYFQLESINDHNGNKIPMPDSHRHWQFHEGNAFQLSGDPRSTGAYSPEGFGPNPQPGTSGAGPSAGGSGPGGGSGPSGPKT